jgi:hypothetical protein
MISRAILLTKRNVAEKVVHRIKTHILYSITIFRKSCLLWDNVEKYCRSGQATDDNMMSAHCMLDTKDYKNALGLRNTYCCSTATMVSRKRLKITFKCTLSVLSAVTVGATHRKECAKGLKTPVQGEDLIPESSESRRNNEGGSIRPSRSLFV